MNTYLKGIRPTDYALFAALALIGVANMLENVLGPRTDGDLAHSITNQSWLMVPLYVAAVAPILWRRRSMGLVIVATAAVLGAHVLAFDWVVRCGAGLPLSFALAYGVGRLSSRQERAPLFVGVIGVQFLVLVRDSAAGLSIFPYTAAIALAFLGIGVLVTRQAAKRADRAAATADVLV